MKLPAPCLALALLTTSAFGQLSITIDYTYDEGFFTGGNVGRQTYLQDAADYLADLLSGTSLSAITPGGSNSWNAQIFDPRNSGSTVQLGNISIAADTIVVYAGGYDLDGSTLGRGGPGGYSASGFQSWFDTLSYRGNDQKASWGGAITFDTLTSWYFDDDITTVEDFAGQYDFFTVAVHELGHLLGLGTNSEWTALVSGGSFTGAESVSVYGGTVPLNVGEDHWQSGTISDSIYGTGNAAMNPSIATNTRNYFTELDIAALNDIGYTASAVPEPVTTATLAAVATLAVAGLRRRRSRLPSEQI